MVDSANEKTGSNLGISFEGPVEDDNRNSLSCKTIHSEHPSPFSISHVHVEDVTWEEFVHARPNYIYAVPHILTLRSWSTPQKNQK